MEFMSQIFSEATIIFTETWVDDNFVLIAVAIFLIELIRYAFKKKLSWNMLGDSATNFVTLFFLLVTIFFVGLAYVCLLYTSPSPRDPKISRMPSSA